jgi:hypothetical protein
MTAIRRLFYVGSHRPGVVRPLPAWPPARDPWQNDAVTTVLPAIGGAW